MKKRITEQDYIKAHRKASREEEIAMYGRPLPKNRVHRSKKQYDRKKTKAGFKRLPDFFGNAVWRDLSMYSPRIA